MADDKTGDIFGLEGISAQPVNTNEESRWLWEQFKLPHNPFPPSGISPDTPEDPPLKEQSGKEITPLITEFIQSAYRNRAASRSLAIVGTYGTGKSHILRLMHNQINERLGSGDERALSIYVQRPRIEAQDLNRDILKSLGEDTIRKMLWFSIRGNLAHDVMDPLMRTSLHAQIFGPIFTQGGKQPQQTSFTGVFSAENLEDYRKFFQAYDQQGWSRTHLRPYFRQLFIRAVQSQSAQDVVDSFIALLLAPDAQSRSTWESLLTLGQIRRMPQLAAPEFLRDLLRLFKINGYVYTFLLIDEFEEVPQGSLLTKRQRVEYLYTVLEILNILPDG